MDAVIDELMVQQILDGDAELGAAIPEQAKAAGGLDYDALAHGLKKKPKAGAPDKQAALRGKKGAVTVSLTDQRSPLHIYARNRGIATPQRQPEQSSEPLDDAALARRLQEEEQKG